MRISRYLRYALIGVLSLCAFSAYAVERPVSYISASSARERPALL